MKTLHAKALTLLFALLCLATLFAPLAHSAAIDDADALSGYRQGRILFDINTSAPDKMALYLSVIKQTREDLLKQGMTPDLILAFRGLAVTLVQRQTTDRSAEQAALDAKIAGLVGQLGQMGVKMEACSVATGLFGVDNTNLLPGIKVVGNTFVSLMGYQHAGYAIIPIQ